MALKDWMRKQAKKEIPNWYRVYFGFCLGTATTLITLTFIIF